MFIELPNFGFRRDGDSVEATLSTDALMSNKVIAYVSRVTVAASASGNTQIVAAVTNKKIRVVGGQLSCNGTVDVKWQSATTDITKRNFGVINKDIRYEFNPVGHFETGVGSALNLNLSAAVAVEGFIEYIEV